MVKNAAWILALLSLIGNFGQQVYIQKINNKYQAREKLREFIETKKSQYQSELDSAMNEVEQRLNDLSSFNAQIVKDKADELETHRQGMISEIMRAETEYHKEHDKTYPISTQESFRHIGQPPFRDRVINLLRGKFQDLQNASQFDDLTKVIAFVDVIDRTKLVLKPKGGEKVGGVNVREEPNDKAKIHTQVNEKVEIYLVDVNDDESWYFIRGKMVEDFEGWVDKALLIIPPGNFLDRSVS